MPGGASVSSWHRQQHKKQQQKNKTERIAARDKAVVESKTDKEIQEEIRNLLNKPHKSVKDEALLPHGVKSRLDRLRKELRLVQEHAKNQPSSNHPASATSSQTAIQRNQQGPSFQKLENPQLSVYYDPVLNPYGAPPPGQPMLYHRRGGGVTMNLNEANWLPPSVHQHTEPGNSVSAMQQTPLVEPRTSHVSPPPPPPPPPQQQQQQQSAASHPGGVRTKGKTPKPKEPETIQHRPRRNILDVWAHEEEKELIEEVEKKGEVGDDERSTRVPAPAATTRAPVRTAAQITVSSSSWYYRDQAGAVQGPYETLQMQQWIEAGFFPGTTPVKPTHNHRSEEPPWSSLDKQPPFCTSFASVPASGSRDSNPDGTRVKERGRQHSTDGKADEDENDAIQARIAALKADQSPNNLVGQKEHSDHEHIVDELSQPQSDPANANEASVQDRIAALRQSRMRELSESPIGDESQPHLSSVQARIQALRQSRGGSVAGDLQQPPAPPPPPPPPRPPSVGHSGDNVPADELYYPVDTDDAILADQGDYPVDDSFASIEQDTMNGSSESGGIPATVMYPVTDVYPMDDEDGGDVAEIGEGHGADINTNGRITKKRQYQADTAVVALLPSHLQKRRPPVREANDGKTENSSGPSNVLQGSSGDGDLESFFQEAENEN